MGTSMPTRYSSICMMSFPRRCSRNEIASPKVTRGAGHKLGTSVRMAADRRALARHSARLEHNPIGLNQYRKGRDSQTRSDRRVLPDRMIRGTSDAEGLFPGLAGAGDWCG